MNNQEKARQLQLDCIKNGCGDSTDIRCACEEMAEWKDQQFKEYLMMKRRKLKKRTRWFSVGDSTSREDMLH